MEISGFFSMVGELEILDGALFPVFVGMLLLAVLSSEIIGEFFCVFEAGAPADGIAVEVGESVEDTIDALGVAVEGVECADEYDFTAPHGEESIESEDEEGSRTARHARHEPFPFIESGVPLEKVERGEHALHDIAREEGFHAEDDDGGNIADAVIDLGGHFVFELAEFAVLRDDRAIEFDDDADRDEGGEADDEYRIEIENHESDDGTDEFDEGLDDLEHILREVEECPRTFLDLVDGVSGMVVGVPRHREGEGAFEEILPVIRLDEECIPRFDDAGRSVKDPESDGLYHEERDEEEEMVEIFLGDTLFLHGIENLSDDEGLEQRDDVGDDEHRHKKDNPSVIAFGKFPSRFGEVINRIIEHKGKACGWEIRLRRSTSSS
jgi:hypothetical protein